MPPDAPVNILMVDDQPENLVALEAVLGDLDANLVTSTSGEEALRCLLHSDFAVILLDVQMPQMDGFELATLIRQRRRSRDTPIIFLTAFSSNEQFMFKGYALGAVDYLIKPIAPNVLLSKVAIFIELFKKTQALRQKTAQLEATNHELQLSEERFRLLCTCSPVGVFVTDVDGNFVYANPRFQTICGGLDCSESGNAESAGTESREPDPPQGWLTCVHADDCDRAHTTWTTYLDGGQEYAQEFRFQGDTECWVAVRSARLLSDQAVLLGYVGTVEDITERKQAEVANAQIIQAQAARQEAETANRMKDEFIAVLSHELRTPLNSILGWSHLLRSRDLSPEKVTFAIDTIERNAVVQKQLIEDILDVSQIVRGKLQIHRQPVDLVSVAQTALETVRPGAEAKAIALLDNVHASPRLEVTGDPLRLQQVVWNLLTNAIKFTPNQGQVDLHLALVDAVPPDAPDAPIPPPYAQLRIRDTGLGITPDFLPHIFDRFRQADSSTTRAQSGLGLGLAIVHHLVDQHQGRVWAESVGPNQGACFTVVLPLAATPAIAPVTGSGAAPGPETLGERGLEGLSVLVIDDDDDTRGFLTTLLESQGATVITAASARDGLRQLTTAQPSLLLCDISMPDMDGYALIKTIRTNLAEAKAQIPAIAITAHARIPDQEQALAAGFQGHLPKPIEAKSLIHTILQVTGAIAP